MNDIGLRPFNVGRMRSQLESTRPTIQAPVRCGFKTTAGGFPLVCRRESHTQGTDHYFVHDESCLCRSAVPVGDRGQQT